MRDECGATLAIGALDLPKLVDRTLGPSAYVTVDQAMIDKFAEATGDHHWIHVDVARAAREMPGGKTIAHGYLTLALIPRMMYQMLAVQCRNALNYGSNKVRYTGIVPAGSRICLYQQIKDAEPVAGNGMRLTSECRIMREGEDKPVLVAEVMAIYYA